METQIGIILESMNENEFTTRIQNFYNQHNIDQQMLAMLYKKYTYAENTIHKNKYTRLSVIFELTHLYITKNRYKLNFLPLFYHFVFFKIYNFIDECSASKLYRILAKASKFECTEYNSYILSFCDTYNKTKYCKCYIQKIINNFSTEYLKKNITNYKNIKSYILRALYVKEKYMFEKELYKYFNTINNETLDTETCQLLDIYDAVIYKDFFPTIFTKIGHRNLIKLFNVLSLRQKKSCPKVKTQR